MNQRKIRIIKVLNPFDVSKKEIVELDYEPLRPVKYYLDKAGITVDTVKALNGNVLDDADENYIVPEGAEIVVKPVLEGHSWKSILRVIATIIVTAAAIATFIIALPVMGPFLAAVASAAVSTGGMMLVNAVLPPPKPEMPSMSAPKISQTYGWDGVKTRMTEGIPIPVLYGKTKVGGNVIAKSVETVDNKQYLDMLLALCHGEVYDITDIKINNNPIDNYHDVTSEIRYGTNDQTPIKYFNTVEVDNPQSVEVSYNRPFVVTTQGNMVDAIKVEVQFPYGLGYANDDGGIDARSVKLRIEYKKHDDTTWTVFDEPEISAATFSILRKSYKITDLPSAQYDVRITRITGDHTDARIKDKVYLTNVVEITSEDFAYPNVALLGIRALATDQLSGAMPNVTCIVDRGTFSSDDIGVVSTLYGKESSNPAWAVYDILTNKLYGAGRAGFDESHLDLDSFQRWADFCDDNNIKVNIIFDTEVSVWDACLRIAQMARGILKIEGTKVSVAIDEPSLPTQLFTVGNIIKDTFHETFLPRSERANCLEVTFWNEEHDYQREVFAIHTDDWEVGNEIKQSITLYGVTNYDQAVKEAQYRLNYNKYLTRVIEFEADIDAIACTVGDVIRVQHDVPEWGEGGRVVDAGSDYVKIDRQIDLVAGDTYKFVCRLQDDTVIEKEFTPSTTETTDTLPITFSTVETPPSKYDVYTVGKATLAYKEFRVIGITRTQDLQRKITAIEYNESIYTDQPTPVPLPIYDYDISAKGLTAQQIEVVRPEGKKAAVQLSWYTKNQYVTEWKVYYRLNLSAPGFGESEFGWINFGEEYESLGEWQLYKTTRTTSCIVDIDYIYGGEYEFAVAGVAPFKIESPDEASNVSIIVKNIENPAFWPDGAEITGKFGEQLSIEWTNAVIQDLKYYVVYYHEVGEEKVIKTESNKLFIDTPKQRSYTFKVYAIDAWGNTSTPLEATFVNKAPAPPSNVQASTSHSSILIWWTAPSDTDVIGYNVYVNNQKVAFVKGDTYLYQAFPETTYTIRVASVDCLGEGNKSDAISVTTESLLTRAVCDVPLTEGIEWSVGTAGVSWTAGKLYYKGYTFEIEAGSTSDAYIWWDFNDSPTTFHTSASAPVVGGSIWLMAYYDANLGKVFPAYQNKIIHGGLIQASTITAEQIGANEIITQSANIKDGVIETAKIADAAITDAKISGIIKSSALAPDGYPYWKVDKAGSAEFHGITIYDSYGNPILTTDSVLWDKISGAGKPEDNATVGAIAGTNLKDSSGTTVLGDADIITSQGTSADTSAVNTISSSLVRQSIGANFRNGFEGAEFDQWVAASGNTISKSTDAYSGTTAAFITCSLGTATPSSGGTTGGVYIAIPEEIALAFGGKRIRVTVYAKQPLDTATASSQFAVAYSTNDVGNSGWQYFTPTSSWTPYSFIYDVPTPSNGGADYLGIWGDTSGTGLGVLIDNVVIEIINDKITSTNVDTHIGDGAIYATKLNVAQLSAITADLGDITAGKAHDLNGKFVIDFTNGFLEVIDDNGVVRVKLGVL